MLAGLLFAINDAEDRPDRLAATLPFAGATLIEYQARLLAAAGASQIVVAVARLTPDLLGAISRIGKRGLAVDAVRTAAEAAEKLHPLARVIVLADGLVTTENVLRPLAGEGGDTLLVVGEDEAGPDFERIGGKLAWAGAARVTVPRIRDVARMPRDYDLQSALLRAGVQAGAAHLLLPPTAKAEGHGLEHRAAALEARGRTVLQAAMSGARGWFDRWVVAPVGRLLLPALVTRGIPTAGAALAGALLGAGGLAAIYADLHAVGLLAALGSTIAFALGGTLADLRDEAALARGQAIARAVLPALALLLLAWTLGRWSGEGTAIVAAISLVLFGVLVERAAAGVERPLWWASPGAYLLITLAATLAGAPVTGLLAAELYAAATLYDAIGRRSR
ncbi:hypothetical protein [Sphingomonas lenta]|uniref:Uncharacterized protein n=1 Tax=Sphingomonas lenta TaxID=1141887 RepID=A0A2A2SJJ6_9SPHN|nr:hypothetical protein [Sphingomonas lenta]PAX09330.1 hypothetical protein CKY28_00795 [Sphingomonas lenta]